jgi:hypothetical protein
MQTQERRLRGTGVKYASTSYPSCFSAASLRPANNRSKGIVKKFCFFAGGISSLRTHISRHPDHVSLYKSRCQTLNIPMHPRALMRDVTDDNLNQQPTLDGAFPHQPKIPVFTTDGLLDYMVELIVCEDKVHLWIVDP